MFSCCFFLDLVAIPDFLAGAMENWGLITFRETTLLVGNESSPLDKQVVASVIAHELAHQVLLFSAESVIETETVNMFRVLIDLCFAVVWEPGNYEMVE